ncbi:MAG: hypothetical protein ACLGIA_03505 [Actinomycetes bacterium]
MTSAQQTATASLRMGTSVQADRSVGVDTSVGLDTPVGVGTSFRVDTEVLDGAAASLLAPSTECLRLAEDLLSRAPDPGPKSALDLLGELLDGAVDALTALAAGLTRSSRDLSAAAEAYRVHERAAQQAAARAAAVLDGA